MGFSNFWRVISRTGVIVVTSALGLSSTATSGEGNWNRYDFRLSGYEFCIKLPGSESVEYPVKPAKHMVDINDLSNYQNWFESIEVFDKYWEYREVFRVGSVGTLRVSAMVRLSSNDAAPTNVSSVGNADAMKNDIKRRYEHNQLKSGLGVESSFVNLMVKNFNGKDWFYYQAKDANVYAAQIGDRHYLEIRFRFIDNSRGGKADWLERARSDELKIMSSVVLKGQR